MSFEARLKVLTIFFLVFLCLITVRLFYLQVIIGDKLVSAAQNQHFAELEIPAQRGKILAIDGTPIVTNHKSYLIFANAKKITVPPSEILEKIGTISGNLNDPKAIWVPLKSRVTKEEKDRIMNYKITGIDYAEEPIRFYPEASSAAHILGFVGMDINSRPKGYFGLEGNYERELSGRAGYKRLEKDAFGRPIALAIETTIPAEDGRDLTTSIDKTAQMIVESHLKEGVKTWGAISGTVIVMDPNIGSIIAMASIPSYDPEKYTDYDSELYKNPGVAETFEPGSIMKPLIMAAAINENKLTPQTNCPVCAGPRSLGGGVIRTFNNQYHPNLTMTDVLVNSDNTGMVYVGESLGKDLLLSYLYKYQFGQKTGIDLEEEEAGRVKTEWYPLDLATVTFGQGVAVTPIQMARGFSVIANGGYLVTPHVVSKINNYSVPPATKVRILSEETAKKITAMLVEVNLKSPLHFPLERTANLSHYKIAAKSGTAQIPIAGSYTDEKTIASVIGFAPADEPKFVVYVKLNEPQVRIWGSDTAGPVFYNIVRDLLLYYNVSP